MFGRAHRIWIFFRAGCWLTRLTPLKRINILVEITQHRPVLNANMFVGILSCCYNTGESPGGPSNRGQ